MQRQITEKDALATARRRIPFTGDFRADCGISDGMFLAELAMQCGFEKPEDAPGSYCRAFYDHLYDKYFGDGTYND
jgi:hypothetical protein